MTISLNPTLDASTLTAVPQRARQLQIVPAEITPEGVHFYPKISLEKQDGLTCLRGVATAVGVQAALLMLAFAAWKLI